MTDDLLGLGAELRKAKFLTSRCPNDGTYMRAEYSCWGEHKPCIVCNENNWEDVIMLPADLVAKEMVGIIAALKAIKNNDKTTAYTYSSGSKNREGKAPKRGQRWATPYEIAQEELQRLENVKEAFK